MSLFSVVLPGHGGRRGYGRAAAAACAGAAALIAGCSSTGGSGAGGARATSLTPRQAITLASANASKISSLTGDYTVRTGTTGTEITTGTMSAQLRPSLLISENLTVSAAGHELVMSELLTTQAVYLKESALSAQTGKPWTKIALSGLSGGAGSALSQLLQSAENGNPLEQTQMLAGASDVRAAGMQVVDGVRTTRYTGSFTAREAVGALSPGLRKSVAPMLSMLSGDIRFNVWIDGQHQVRKLIDRETVAGQPVTATMTVTSIDQPVHLGLPPASQVAEMPGSDPGDL
jgi:hypothetical protein